MTLQGPKIGKCWYLIGTIVLENVLWDLDFVKIGYWAPKAQKYQLSSKKGPKGVKIIISDISQQLWLYKAKKIAKCWYIIGTIALENVLWVIDFVKAGYWAPKVQK